MTALAQEHCRALRGAEHRLEPQQMQALLEQLSGWQIEGQRLVRDFRFPDYKATIFFVNSVACLAERENHHPDLEVGYRHVKVAYTTHDVGGLSRNDFICAAKLQELIVT
jgi:4a-hydroxytetrahydrobiopterin dehydratase